MNIPALALKFLKKPIARIGVYVLTPLITFLIAKFAIVAPDAAGTIDAAKLAGEITTYLIAAGESAISVIDHQNAKALQAEVNEALPADQQLKVDGNIGPVTRSVVAKKVRGGLFKG